jgi:hypothetical protein
MKLSEMPNIKKKISEFKLQKSNAMSRRLEILPSISGPYIMIDGSPRRANSPEYIVATSSPV